MTARLSDKEIKSMFRECYDAVELPSYAPVDADITFARAVERATMQRCVELCLIKWEGYGGFKTQRTGSECAAAIRAAFGEGG